MGENSRKQIWTRLLQVVSIVLLCMIVVKVDVSAATRNVTLKSGKAYNANWSGNDTIYHKIIVPADGYIKVTGWGRYPNSTYKQSLYPQFLNSKKKALAGNSTSLLYYANPAYTTYYGVKKGTYYIKIANKQYYTLKYTYTKKKDQSGSSKAKAASLKKNVYKNGLAIAGEKGSKADWFKFTLPKDQNVTLVFGARANKNIRFEIIPANSRIKIYGNSVDVTSGKKTLKFNRALWAGTYYVKVYRQGNNKQANGNYYLKWK